MPVYDGNGNELYAVYDGEGNRLYQAYDGEGNPLIDTGLIINTDTSTGTDSGYTLTSDNYDSTYVLRLLADWGTTEFQSVIMNTSTNEFNRMGTTATVNRFSESMASVGNTTLASTGGHKNDAVYDDGFMYMLDGTANDSKSLYVWNTSNNTVTQVTLPISNNTNGSLRVVAGICKSDTDGYLYLVSRDQYNNSDIDHQTGDVMCVYRYNIANNTVELMDSYDWDCVYVQGATYYNGILYVTCNTGTTGSASNYTGITVKCIRTDTWQLIDELTVSGSFEPEGIDTVSFTEYGTELTMGIGKWNAISKFVRFTPPYELVKSYSGKSLSILGDSISTYDGYIPSGNANFYTGSNCGVTSVNQTWWKRVIDSLGMTLNLNNSWSGSRVSTTNGTESAGVTRASNLGTNPNVIIVYMGINDFNNEVATATFRSAYGTMLDNIKTAYPNAELYCSTLPVCERNGATGDPEINDDGVYLSEYNQIITEVATAKGADILDLANCGITYATLSTYMGDWESATGKALHPNADGHALIAQKAIADLQS